MLVLTRKEDESIMIGDDITIRVVRISGNQVHLGITAPREIAVHRQEIYDLAKAENLTAASGAGPHESAVQQKMAQIRSLMTEKSE